MRIGTDVWKLFAQSDIVPDLHCDGHRGEHAEELSKGHTVVGLGLDKQIVNHIALDVRQPEIATVVTIREAFVFQS